MFQLLQPIWLFSIAAIIIPLIIHLWNIREGKTLRIGSISLLLQSAKQQARSFRLKNILLLILRCLLIITLAFLLAKPGWIKQLTVHTEKGWILIEKQSVAAVYKNYAPLIDSLVEAGYQFHYFNKGFSPQKLSDALKKTVPDKSENLMSYWSLLKQLNEEVPSALPIYLFTDNRLQRFAGTRPLLSLHLKWYTYTPGDTSGMPPVVKAFETATDSIRIVLAHSASAATFYTFENIVKHTNARYQLNNNKGKIVVSARGNSTNTGKEVDTSTLRIAIYTDQFFTDAGYLKAAIEAIQEYTSLKIKVAVVNNIDDLKNGNDWLFWLSEKAIPLAGLPPNVFVYEKGKEQRTNSWITPKNNLSINGEAIHLWRLIESNTMTENAEPLWKDGFGRTIISREKTKRCNYHFYSRFNPNWNDLPWSATFADMVFGLLFNPPADTKYFDNRTIPNSQFQPEITQEDKAFTKQKFIEKTSLSKLFWIIGFIIFCIERYMSLTNKRNGIYA